VPTYYGYVGLMYVASNAAHNTQHASDSAHPQVSR